MIREWLIKIPFAPRFAEKFNYKRMILSYTKIKKYLNKKEKIIDIGAGTCHLTKFLIDKGYSVTPIDIADFSIYPNIKSILFDGGKIPFKDNEFETAIIIQVLHHVKKLDVLLKGTARVAEKIIVMEDIYENVGQKIFGYLLDSATNLEFIGTRNYKSDRQWRKTFSDCGLKLKDTEGFKAQISHRVYFLER